MEYFGFKFWVIVFTDVLNEEWSLLGENMDYFLKERKIKIGDG